MFHLMCVCLLLHGSGCLQFTHWGEYQLTEDLLPLDIYLALPRPLFCRLGTLQPLRVHQGGKYNYTYEQLLHLKH